MKTFPVKLVLIFFDWFDQCVCCIVIRQSLCLLWRGRRRQQIEYIFKFVYIWTVTFFAHSHRFVQKGVVVATQIFKCNEFIIDWICEKEYFTVEDQCEENYVCSTLLKFKMCEKRILSAILNASCR